MLADKILSQVITNTDFKLAVFDRLNQLRKDNILCDVSLKADGQTHQAHRNVLSAASPYFLGLFTHDMQERESSTIDIKLMSSKVSEDIISYIYTGEIKIDQCNAREIVMAADYLLIPSLKTSASAFLERTMNPENCVSVRDFAVKYNCLTLTEAAECFINKSFLTISKTGDFNKLGFESVLDLVSRDNIKVTKEEDVFEAIMRWVKHDVPNRKEYLTPLLKKVRFFSMSKYTLQENLKEEELILEDSECTKVFLNGMQMHLFPDSTLHHYLHPRHCLQDIVKVVVLAGGHTSRMKPIPRILAYCPPNGLWYWIHSDMPDPRTRHSAIVCEGSLYILGGTPTCTIERFDHRVETWNSDCKAMGNPVMHAAVVTYKEKIILIGGENRLNNVGGTVDKVQEYDPKLNEWRFLANMSCSRAALCAVSLGKFIYAIGGFGSGGVHGSGERYDPLKDEWTAIADMSYKRRFAAGAALRGKLFIAGGYHAIEWIAHASCELYNPDADSWQVIVSMPMPRAACGIVQVEDDVFLFGGENGGKPDDKLDSVVRYNAGTSAWDRVTAMPEARSCLQACIMHLPRKVLDPLEINTDDELLL